MSETSKKKGCTLTSVMIRDELRECIRQEKSQSSVTITFIINDCLEKRYAVPDTEVSNDENV